MQRLAVSAIVGIAMVGMNGTAQAQPYLKGNDTGGNRRECRRGETSCHGGAPLRQPLSTTGWALGQSGPDPSR